MIIWFVGSERETGFTGIINKYIIIKLLCTAAL